MIYKVTRLVVLLLGLLPPLAAAEPVTLKLAYFSSDRTHLYHSGAEPFVNAVNRAGRGRVKIEPYFSGRLGDLSEQSQRVRDGTADIGYVVPPYERAAFPDASVIELPGLYRNAAEATAVFTELVRSDVMRGFKDFYVIGAFASEPETIHSRPPLTSLAELRGERVRVNNDFEAQLLAKLGAKPKFIPLNRAADAISAGQIDAAVVPPAPMIEFGIGRVASHHYLLPTSCVPQALLMNRKRFESLPSDVQATIREHSGIWFVDNYNRINEAATARVLDQLKSDSRRTVVAPSAADMKTVDTAAEAIVAAYAAKSRHNAELVEAARKVLARLRSAR